jgi:hypothetical protein
LHYNFGTSISLYVVSQNFALLKIPNMDCFSKFSFNVSVTSGIKAHKWFQVSHICWYNFSCVKYRRKGTVVTKALQILTRIYVCVCIYVIRIGRNKKILTIIIGKDMEKWYRDILVLSGIHIILQSCNFTSRYPSWRNTVLWQSIISIMTEVSRNMIKWILKLKIINKVQDKQKSHIQNK